MINNLDKIQLHIHSQLKDFQNSTVERIMDRFQNGIKRVLVSDEVGLGKTLIAKGTIIDFVKYIKQIKPKKEVIKIAYICSNGAIADQNISKLQMLDNQINGDTSSSRLSMQHLKIYEQNNDPNNKDKVIQLIPLTPSTSFNITLGAGTVSERALMYVFLQEIPELKEYKKALEIIFIDFAFTSWNSTHGYYKYRVEKCGSTYKDLILSKLRNYLLEVNNNTNLLDRIIDECEKIKDNNYQRINSNQLISSLRTIFAKISLGLLKPDLAIMDEFQRFKSLLVDANSNQNENNLTELNSVAKSFFNNKDLYILLLSATPFKMYQTLEEDREDNYKEFLDVVHFLLENDPNKMEQFDTKWKQFTQSLKSNNDKDNLLKVKSEAEALLYRNICRTERLSANENIDIIDTSQVKNITPTENDIIGYLNMEKLLTKLNIGFHTPIDYIKSSPYLLSFMKDYELKRKIENKIIANPDLLQEASKKELWMSTKNIDKYKPLEKSNAKLESLKEQIFQNQSELLLWVPPCKNYYIPDINSPYYKNPYFSKILVFSSWAMVPRMVSSLISYETERKTVFKMIKIRRKHSKYHYFMASNENRYPSPYKIDNNTIPLLYPCQYLTNIYDPIFYLNNGYSLTEIEKDLRNKIITHVNEINNLYGEDISSLKIDKRWYYLSPLLLDSNEYCNNWFNNVFIGAKDSDNSLLKIVKDIKNEYDALIQENIKLPKLDSDNVSILTDFLVDLTLSSPSIALSRSYKKYFSKNNSYEITKTSKSFINRMNTPESISCINLVYKQLPESKNKARISYWQRFLIYAKHGNIQAMFDEYIHLLSNGMDFINEEIAFKYLNNKVDASFASNTASYNIDTYESFSKRVQNKSDTKHYFRTHFALSFTSGEIDNNSATNRLNNVRIGFNSPLRPFVLTTTSIGQEGLDFHYYCRKVFHWNLPSNPIDLEQREGRINRYESLAIRRNIAKYFENKKDFKNDIWDEMFNELTKNNYSSNLIPYWGLSKFDSVFKIERIIPLFPLSNDRYKYERIIKILSLYRIILGQPRQEELIDKLEKYKDDKELFINLSPHYK